MLLWITRGFLVALSVPVIMSAMILDAEPFAIFEQTRKNGFRSAITSFVSFIERKLGIIAVLDKRDFPYGRTDLVEQFQLARSLVQSGVLKDFYPVIRLPDEPPFRMWGARDATDEHSGGATLDSDGNALFAALAENMERYIWRTQTDYFDNPRRATIESIKQIGPSIPPSSFASFTDEQRATQPNLHIAPESVFTWIRGTSLTSNSTVYIPSQTISGNRSWQSDQFREPMIRIPITIGLATWPTLAGARLAGALEVVEREAYMIMWLNQLSLPRIGIDALRAQYPSLRKAFALCERYRITPHVIPMLTDAPTHAIAVILEDTTNNAPRFIIGLKAHRSLPIAIEKALVEAMRGRGFCRRELAKNGEWDTARTVDSVGHYERLTYWSHPTHADKLSFLVSGKEIPVPASPWEEMSIEQHLKQVTDWCEKNNFDCVSVSLGRSKKNPTPWSIEMVCIPQLQHTYLKDELRQLGGTRRMEVPKLFGYSPRSTPYLDAPHPYA